MSKGKETKRCSHHQPNHVSMNACLISLLLSSSSLMFSKQNMPCNNKNKLCTNCHKKLNANSNTIHSCNAHLICSNCVTPSGFLCSVCLKQHSHSNLWKKTNSKRLCLNCVMVQVFTGQQHMQVSLS